MNSFPENANFRLQWRSYQQRILDGLETLLSDRHLHIVAPPGSGKTILGLQAVIALNQPTLILAPTIAIRNQWIQRLCTHFLGDETIPDWISHDIKAPGFLTVVTYQALYAACNNLEVPEADEEEEEEDIIQSKTSRKLSSNALKEVVGRLIAQNVKTVVTDEAHHLKNDWWQALIQVKEQLNPVVIGLTATPPYDVSTTEWHRYISLNGPIDTEISTPELVQAGDLCPHQDYIYFTHPTEDELALIAAHRNGMKEMFDVVRRDHVLLEAIETHPIWVDPYAHLEWIYEHVSYYSAGLIFLKDNDRPVSSVQLEVIGDKREAIPAFDPQWCALLLEFYLFKEKNHFHYIRQHQADLEHQLKLKGAIEHQKINFDLNKRLTSMLTGSLGKLRGIGEIVQFEHRQMGNALRMVILCDYIRKEYLTQEKEQLLPLNKLGVLPVFEQLRRNHPTGLKMGVLTGSVVILPVTALDALAQQSLPSGYAISTTPLSYDSNYVLLQLPPSLKHQVVHWVTQIFEQGTIDVLIGTKSLLGEGWDAPAINSLILASFVGSFVLSNQMRGRAIRTEPGNDDKTANIWHLVCSDPSSPSGGYDVETMTRRFKTFAGVSLDGTPFIQNGIERLLPAGFQGSEMEAHNTLMFKSASDRAGLKTRWITALESGNCFIEEIVIPFREQRPYKPLKILYLRKTIVNLLITVGTSWMLFGEHTFLALSRSMPRIKSINELYTVLMLFLVGGIVLFGRKTLKSFVLYLRYRDIAKDVEHIGKALCHSLYHAKVIKTPLAALTVRTDINEEGEVSCHLEGGSTYEQSAFVNALEEIVGLTDHPRYIIIRKHLSVFGIRQSDYHSVPEVLGGKKELAEYFRGQWVTYAGACDLVYTRSVKGRQVLLRAWARALSARLAQTPRHINRWK